MFLFTIPLQEKEKKKAAKLSQKAASNKAPPAPMLEDFSQGPDQAVPLLIEKCIAFIEDEGLDSEGIYRVPGNKVHVEQLTLKFKEGEKPAEWGGQSCLLVELGRPRF